MSLEFLAVPSVYALITFLAYTSQILLLYLEPYPLEKKQLIRFNVLLICLLITYTRSVLVDPGRIPKNEHEEEEEIENLDEKKHGQPRKWCRKCSAVKPPRSHHCKSCKRQGKFSNCIPFLRLSVPWSLLGGVVKRKRDQPGFTQPYLHNFCPTIPLIDDNTLWLYHFKSLIS